MAESIREIAKYTCRAWSTPARDLSLREEERMAQWLHDNLDTVTRRYASLRSQGETTGV